MRRFPILAACALSVTLAPVLVAGALAQQPQAQQQPAPYTPSVGQAGKDVVWVPTHDALVQQMLDMAQVTPQDYLIDLGSGDGRTVIAAARRGVRAHGLEFNPELVELSRRNAAAAGLSSRATFDEADIFQSDFSRATVVTLFLLQTLNERLRPILLDMEPGTRVVSNTFTMGNWEPDQQFEGTPSCSSFCRAYKWIIPAKVGGNWQVGEGRLELTQNYQMLSGTLTVDGKAQPITAARMNGRQISFTAGGRRYTGEADGNRMSGQIEGGGQWSASRAG
ncbi:SAM-dependent methyltransferase [Pseudoroseomonas globiformis]|uniref:SAM-dependent methyltransferase n=1 Tax=Teichococcus globiformis TaxID=2307229 RepID=A0ABV7G8P8_9PROT